MDSKFPGGPPGPRGPLPGHDCSSRARPAPACDVLIVGGGINGAGIARDAAGRGLSVVLCEQDDLAAHTSSASSCLLHGGLRYLEHFQFGLVRKALIEREVLLRSAPHITRPLRFVLPHDPALRPAWMLRLGVWLYDHLARRDVLPGAAAIALAGHPAGEPLEPRFERAFTYWDGAVDDARLVVLAARDAADRGAVILTRSKVGRASARDGLWRAWVEPASGNAFELRARALVNATGPWAARFRHESLRRAAGPGLRLVKGSHIVVPRLFAHDMAYVFQGPDRRVVFAIPYEHDYTLVGTTDIDCRGDPAAVRADPAEIEYLCARLNRYLRRPISPADVVRSFAGVRPLLDDDPADGPSSATRDYLLEFEPAPAPLLDIRGGKLTTFRRLAEEGVDLLAPALGCTTGAWTRGAALPGGDVAQRPRAGGRPDCDFADFVARQAEALPWLPAPLLRRYARQYGTRIGRVVDGARSLADLGAEVVPGLFEAELDYLVDQEWARTGDDVAWRRTRLGLRSGSGQIGRLDDWIRARLRGAAVPTAVGCRVR